MKKKIVLLGLILTTIIITGLNIIPYAEKETNPLPPTVSRPNVFLIGALQMEGDADYNLKCDELKFNIWHNYIAIKDTMNINGKRRPVPNGWYTFKGDGCNKDSLLFPVSDYATAISSIININYNNGYWSFMERPKIEYLIRGQRSIYQCENYAHLDSEKFYRFLNSDPLRDTLEYDLDSNRHIWVKRFLPGRDTPNSYIVSDVRLKHEQTACKGANPLYLDYHYNWYIKPRIRIPIELPPATPVCIIEVYNFDNLRKVNDTINSDDFKQGGTYNGGYREVVRLSDPSFLKIDGDLLKANDCGTSNEGSQFDIRVKWLGNCEMLIDYVKVESDVAEQIFRTIGNTDDWITNEAELIGTTNGAFRFWVEEPDYNMLPCVKYVQDKIISLNNPNAARLIMNDYSVYIAPHNEEITSYQDYRQKYNSMNMDEIVSMCFFFKLRDSISNELQTQGYNPALGILGDTVSKELYEYTLQNKFDRELIERQKKYAIQYSKDNPEKPFYFGVTTIMNYYPSASLGYFPQGAREPTNQEIQTIGNIMLTYGIKGILYHCYGAFGSLPQQHPDSSYGRGLTNLPDANNTYASKREYNVYGQQKWKAIKEYDEKLEKWGPYLIQFNNSLSESYRYHKIIPSNSIEERNRLISTTFIKHLYAYPNGSILNCPVININNDYPDNSDETYLQVGIFKKSNNDIDKYFMVVNRRCNPGTDPCSGYRRVEAVLGGENNYLDSYNNWKIINVLDNTTVAEFNKNSANTIDLGWFNAGEAKLFKMIPAFFEGGSLKGDETISGNLFCNGKIYGNGYNITINPGATVTFSDSAGIEMNGGTFTCGVNADNANAVTLQKTSSGTGWCGLSLNNCSGVGIYNTTINGVKANDTAKAVSLSNCPIVYLRRNTFTSTYNTGAVQSAFTTSNFDSVSLRIKECNFNMGQSGYSGVNILSNASMTIPVIIEWCNFTTTNDTSNAIMLTNVTGGAIKNNNITGFKKSIVALASAIDVYGNRVIGCNSSYGIQCLSGSDVTMKVVSGYHLGGDNYVRNYGSSSACIHSDNSLFDINTGENNFDLDNIDESKFLTGTLSGTPADNVDAMKNCFHKDSVQNIEGNHSMTWYSSNEPVGFSFSPYTCDLSQNEDFIVFNYGGYNDTVYYTPGGQGSGFNPDKVINIENNAYKSLRDTINLNLRKRSYSVVEDKAKQLLTQYPDSLESIGMVQKLYIASLTLDQNGNKIGQLKTYLENLISSNSQNPALVKRAFYHLQKCKVKLGQYQSALDGFQYIMTQNPYSYEGLVASWDYAATYLLMGQGGSISGETEQMTEELSTPADTLLNRMSRNDSKTKTISDGQKTKIFYEKVKIATKDDKTVQEEKIKQLKKTIESSKSDVTKTKAITELTTMKTIKESVKIKKPNSVKTHVIMINNDIKKIFGIGKGSKTSNVNNLIPKTYELYQNYPNPFNPSTKIAFDLPQDGKVKFVIYDILGRQIKTLVDNELRTAGKYTIEFNGSHLASGIYFYRLQVGGGKTFTAVKKMVMIK